MQYFALHNVKEGPTEHFLIKWGPANPEVPNNLGGPYDRGGHYEKKLTKNIRPTDI